jgi:hypothetical protein
MAQHVTDNVQSIEICVTYGKNLNEEVLLHESLQAFFTIRASRMNPHRCLWTHVLPAILRIQRPDVLVLYIVRHH